MEGKHMHSRLDLQSGAWRGGLLPAATVGGGGALQVFVGPVGLIIDFQRQVAAPVSVSTVVRYCIIKRKGEQPWWGAGKGKARCKQLQHFCL